LRANEVVQTPRLVDELWGERPPATAVKSVQMFVSQLRKALGDGVLETQAGGYRLRVEPGALDLQRFEGLLEEARRHLWAGSAREAGEELRRALALWRGPPLADFEYEPFARSEISRLQELRLAAVELRVEADLATGRHPEVVGELQGLVHEHPLRESLRGLLMLALYRCGRQADALAAYQDARTALVTELGLDPSPALQQLEQAILRQDPALAAGSPAPSLPVATLRTGGAGPAAKAVVAARAQRKVVTVLFADVVGSTALGERLDPEVLRDLLAEYFELMKAIVERHGGVVEKFVGDAVMAVFGVPSVHEDDALRALRAAAEMRAALPRLGLQARMGVNTGEVVTGGEERLVTGDVVNVAARLQQAAAPGAILLGADTHALVADAVKTEELPSLALKGKQRPVEAFRLLALAEWRCVCRRGGSSAAALSWRSCELPGETRSSAQRVIW
jgi:class 3 adenylate cyclase